MSNPLNLGGDITVPPGDTIVPPIVQPEVKIGRGNFSDLVIRRGKEASRTPRSLEIDPPNSVNSPQISNVSDRSLTNQAIAASLALAASSTPASKEDEIIQKFFNNIPGSPDKFLQTGDKRIEDTIRRQLADPAEPSKTYGALFKDRSDFENFFSVLFTRIEDLRDKRESASHKAGKEYQGIDKAAIARLIRTLCDNFANNKVNDKDIEAAKKFLNPPVVALHPQTQNATSDKPFANLRHNERSLIDKFVEITFPNQPSDKTLFLESGSSELEEAIDKQLRQVDMYLLRYGGLFKNSDQLKIFLDEVKEHLKQLGRDAQEYCNRRNNPYLGVQFSEIKKATEVRVFELANNKLNRKFAAYAVSATGGPAVKLTHEFVQSQTHAYLLSLAAKNNEKNKRNKDEEYIAEISMIANDSSVKSDKSSFSLTEQINKDLEDLAKKRAEMTEEAFEMSLQQFYEKYKKLIFEREIQENIKKQDPNSDYS